MIRAFVFPGQGSQAVGMGRGLAEAFPAARHVFQEVDEALKQKLSKLDATTMTAKTLAGDAITSILTHAPFNNAPIGGVKVNTQHGWFAARPSGTENIYKLYAESFRGPDHLQRIVKEAQELVSEALK